MGSFRSVEVFNDYKKANIHNKLTICGMKNANEFFWILNILLSLINGSNVPQLPKQIIVIIDNGKPKANVKDPYNNVNTVVAGVTSVYHTTIMLTLSLLCGWTLDRHNISRKQQRWLVSTVMKNSIPMENVRFGKLES